MYGYESVVVTTSGCIKTSPGGISSISLSAGCGAFAACTLNDSIDGLGDDAWALTSVAGGCATICFPELLLFGVGIYCVPSGVGAKVSVAFA